MERVNQAPETIKPVSPEAETTIAGLLKVIRPKKHQLRLPESDNNR